MIGRGRVCDREGLGVIGEGSVGGIMQMVFSSLQQLTCT